MSEYKALQTLLSSNTSVANSRIHRRVAVNLQAILFDRHNQAHIAHTENISEGGLWLSSYQGPTLLVGDTVAISLDGVVSDQEVDEQPNYSMRVVRQDESGIGLSFL